MVPREFPCMDDDPRNDGNGYNSPNPYDNYEDEYIPDGEDITEEAFGELDYNEPEN